jgi:hypothetical protein
MATKRDGVKCYDMADMDEPIFVLRSTDRFAPVLVRMWAMLAQIGGCSKPKVDEATVCAMRMEEWAARRGSKFPD